MPKRFLFVLLAAATALGLALSGPEAALAKRLGGGDSSGSRSGFSSSRSFQSAPSQQPPSSFGSQSREQPMQRPLPQSQPGGLAQPAPSRPWGGFLGGMLAGGLIGSMLSGGHMGGFPGGGGLGLLDMLLIGGGIWLLFRFMRGRQTPPGQNQGQYGQPEDRPRRDPIPMRPSEPESPQAEDLRRDAANRYARAQAGWDMLRSQPAREAEPKPQDPVQPQAQAPQGSGQGSAQSPAQDFGLEAPPAQAPEVPAGFDTAEFLRGAKAVYARLQASWDARDLEDIRHFTTPEMFEGFARDAKADPAPSRTELVLVNASLLGVTSSQSGQGGQTRASVYYDVLMREDPRASQPDQIKEIWNFVRDDSGPGSNWRLEGIEQAQ